MTAIVTTEQGVEPRRRLWTREEFTRAAGMGLFGSQERLELIEGEIVGKMTQNSPHATGVCLCEDAMRATFARGFAVRIQMPLALTDISQPDPDIAVVRGSVRDYEVEHPTTAALVVEVSDSTLAYDRTTKAAMYAKAGVPEYWILNLNDRLLEVHRRPAPVSEMPGGFGYLEIIRYADEESVTPAAAPDAAPILVADLLPRRQA